MAWGARQHDDGTWRLCERKGRTLLNLSSSAFPGVQISWPTRTGAEKCAKELNEAWWPSYERARDGKQPPPADVPFLWNVIDVIRKHGGITASDYERITS